MRFSLSAALLILPALASAAFDEKTLVCLINNARVGRGLDPLGIAPELETSSLVHSTDMAKSQKLDTVGSDGSGPGDRITAAGFNWVTYGEIVGFGYQDEASLLTNLNKNANYRKYLYGNRLDNVGASLVRTVVDVPYYTLDFASDGNGPRNVPDCSSGLAPGSGGKPTQAAMSAGGSK